jgi:hypothetical protein
MMWLFAARKPAASNGERQLVQPRGRKTAEDAQTLPILLTLTILVKVPAGKAPINSLALVLSGRAEDLLT